MSLRVCRIDDVPDGGARGFRVTGLSSEGSDDRILVWRRDGTVLAYRNRCPHRGTPLDWVQDHFMDRDQVHLVCATHGALFRPEDGHCVAGPCAGEGLDSVPLEIRDGEVYVG